jgi:hypothetical protein
VENRGILDVESEIKEMYGMNDVWLKIAQFLGTLNGENVKRESYVCTPEYEAALEAWKETEQEWEVFLETLPVGEGRGNEGAPGGFCVCPGETGLHSGLCRLCAGVVSYGASEGE